MTRHMKFTGQPWSPEYGSPGGMEDLEPPEAVVDIEVDTVTEVRQ